MIVFTLPGKADAIIGLTKFADPLHKMAFRNDPLHKSLVSSLEGPTIPQQTIDKPPTKADPAVTEAQKKLRIAELNRRGRSSTLISGLEDEMLGTVNIARPKARAANFGA
jgi:hypothetical protein